MPDDTPSNIVPFPHRLRVVTTREAPQPASPVASMVVEHDGRTYRLEDLMSRLTFAEQQMIASAASWTAQGVWDAVVRRWPALAAEIVAATWVVG